MPSDAKVLREGGIEALRAMWREKGRLYRQRHYVPHPRPITYRTKPCAWCSVPFSSRDKQHRKYCSDECSQQGRRETSRRYWRLHPERRRPDKPRPKPQRVRYASCLNCRRLMVLHGGQRLCDLPDCRASNHRITMREYMRRTHYMGEHYWRIDNTPEARDIARTYFELRSALRRI